jgi:hypothetical protein
MTDNTPGMGLAPSQGKKWIRFQQARSQKVGQISTGVDNRRVDDRSIRLSR